MSRPFLYMCLAQVSITTAVVLLIVPMGGGWREFGSNCLYGLAFANCIGWPSWFVMPHIGIQAAHFKPFARWAFVIAAILGITVAGSLAAVALLASLSAFPWSAYWPRFWGGLQISMVIALVTGLGFFLVETLKYRLQLETTQATLASLKSRVQPHFLFNTLNSISALIPDDPEAAECMVQKLSGLLRYSLDLTERQTVPFEKEIRVITDFLEIQKMRFGDRLRYSIDIPESLKQREVPPFAVQTLLENSITHGGSEIRIAARRLGDGLKIDVWDSGPGFTADLIQPGHGLENLRSRLQMLWGAGASLEIYPENTGSLVRISIPGER